MNDIINMLDQLAEYRAATDALRLAYEEQRKALIPPEVKQALDKLDAEYSHQTQAVSENIDSLEAAVKELVISHGASVKAAHLQAVWSKGRVSWDTKALDGYTAAHPEIAQFRKEGAPSVSIRSVS